jgi:hypothetical protein
MATNVLMRDLPSKRYAQVGATGNRFFTIRDAVPIPHGAVVCKGFMQYVHRPARDIFFDELTSLGHSVPLGLDCPFST